jgi:hypothetical protein
MLTFDEETHIYRWENKIVPSVTQVPNRVAVRNGEDGEWRSVSGSEYMGNYEVARRYGNAFHKAASYTVSDTPCKYDPALEPDIISLKMFLAKYKIFPEIVEQPLYSKFYGYAGSPDLYGHISFDKPKITLPILLEWKTATSFNEHWRGQTAAYAQLIKEETGIKRKPHRWSVRFKQDGKMPEIDKRHNHPQDFNRFLSLLNVYKTYSKE